MRRRVRAPRRTKAEWGVRAVLALLTAAIGYAGVTRTIGYASRAGNVAFAHALAPGDGRITGLYAQSLAGPQASPADRRRADEEARRALRQDPTAVAAASTLGLDAQIGGDAAGARRLFGYAERLSRRDLQTQIWAVEDAVARGDVAGALRHYDVALRTSRDAPDLLFPILTGAIADPAIAPALVRTLAGRPIWTQAFIEYVAAHDADSGARARLFRALSAAGIPISDNARAAAVDALVRQRRYGEAWTYYATVRAGADRRRSRDPGFDAGPDTPSLLDWAAVDMPGAVVSLTGGLADVAVPAAGDGPVLRQLQLLPAGPYRLTGRVLPSGSAGTAAGYWSLTCLDGRALGRVPLPRSGSGSFAGNLAVPADCPAQYLSLTATSPDGIAAVGLQVDDVLLRPAG